MLRSSLHVHLPQGHPDGARGADDDSVAIMAQTDCSLDDGGQGGQQGLVGLLVDYGGGAFCERVSTTMLVRTRNKVVYK